MQVITTIIKRKNFTLQYKPARVRIFHDNQIQASLPQIQNFKVLGGGDTTNSIVRVTMETQKGPKRLVLKSYLRVFESNIEAARFSHLHAVKFSAVPELEGTLVLGWRMKYTRYTLLLISQFVENEGDGGKPFWDHLQEYLLITQTQKYFKSVLQKIGPLGQLVGQTTREFHDALAKKRSGQIQQGNVTAVEIAFWEEEFRKNLTDGVKLWAQRQPLLFPHVLPEIVAKISKFLTNLTSQIPSGALIHSSLVPITQPIHGDLHLGQFLYQPGPPARFIVTDLEGDPQLPPDRRQESRTVWFDLGGLLRSLDYIAFFGTLESLKQQIPAHPWSAEDIFALFLARLMGSPMPPSLEQFSWAGESTVVHALEWAEFVGKQILIGYGAIEKLEGQVPLTFRLIRATSELNYELGFRGQNALVPLLGVLAIGNRWLELRIQEWV